MFYVPNIYTERIGMEFRTRCDKKSQRKTRKLISVFYNFVFFVLIRIYLGFLGDADRTFIVVNEQPYPDGAPDNDTGRL